MIAGLLLLPVDAKAADWPNPPGDSDVEYIVSHIPEFAGGFPVKCESFDTTDGNKDEKTFKVYYFSGNHSGSLDYYLFKWDGSIWNVGETSYSSEDDLKAAFEGKSKDEINGYIGNKYSIFWVKGPSESVPLTASPVSGHTHS